MKKDRPVSQPNAAETYRQQLDRLAQAMAQPNCEGDVALDVPDGIPLARIKMFVDGNLEKRFDKLTNELEFVAGAFDGFDKLIREYIGSNPLTALDSSASDGQRMLPWLSDSRRLTFIQNDYVSCHLARHDVEQLGRTHRVAHVRFHDLRGLTKQCLARLDLDDQLQLYLNPTAAWTQFITTEFLDENETPPVDVVFFAVGTEIATAVIEPSGQALLRELSQIEPCTMATWIAVSEHGQREEIVELTYQLAELGLIALA